MPGSLSGIKGKTAVVIAGGGAICGAIACGLGWRGARVAVWDISDTAAERTVGDIQAEGGEAIAVRCDATDQQAVRDAVKMTLDRFGTIDILVNGAGGSRKDCTTGPDLPFFDIEPRAISDAIALNFAGAVIPSQEVGRVFANKGAGVILNISSIAGLRPLTRAVGYCSAKAALNNFTQWLAVYMAREYSPEIRVNAIAPGFMLTEQNRFLLIDAATGDPTERGREILRTVPMRRYGRPEEIVDLALLLVSDGASFITGAVIPADGGFSAFSGV